MPAAPATIMLRDESYAPIPEPDMEPPAEPQVVVEDRRSEKNIEPEWVEFVGEPLGALLQLQDSPKTIVRKVSVTHAEYLLGCDGATIKELPAIYYVGTDTICRPLPHLRLRMILENA